MGISLHIHGTGPYVPVPRSPRTWPFSPVLAVLVDFPAYPWVFHCISMEPDRTCPFSVFSVFPGLARFRPFWPFWWISLHIHGDFTAYPWDQTVRARSMFSPFSPDLHVFARFGRFSGFRCISMGISLHIHGTGPNVPVPRFLRLSRTSTFSPVLVVLVDFPAYPWGFHCISMGPDRTCPFHVFSVLPGLARFRPS